MLESETENVRRLLAWGVVIELTSIGKHIGWVTLGPASKHGEIKQTEYRNVVLTGAAVEILLQDLVNLGSEGDVMVSELTPSHEQEGQGVVMEAVVPMNMGGDLQIVCDTEPRDDNIMLDTSRAVGSSLPRTEMRGADMPSAKAEGMKREWATMAAPQCGFSRLLQRPSRFL